MYCYYYMCLANYGASEAVNLWSRYVEKSTKYAEQKCASYFRELNQMYCSLTVASASVFDRYMFLIF
jgi:ribonuclease HIII